MTYFVLSPLAPPHQQFGERVGWEEMVPDMERRAEISVTWMDGRTMLNPFEMPRELIINGQERALPSVFSSKGGITICKQELKFILEELDPGIHQFIPIKVAFQSGEVPEDSFFILNIHHMLDTIIDEKTRSQKASGTLPDNSKRHFMLYHLSVRKDGDVTVDKSKLTSVNLWRELAYPGLYMMSDRLQQRLEQEKLAFFEPHKATEF